MSKITGALCAAMLVSCAAQAQTGPANWPTRAVKVITPQPPGTGIDLSCRIFSERLSQKWGQPVVVENRPGGDGVIGVAGFVGSNDDHTLLCSFGGPITITPFTSQTKLAAMASGDAAP